MALTKSDLQAIDNLIVKRVKPLEAKIGGLEKGQANLEKGQANLEKGQKLLTAKVDKIDKKFDGLFNFLDKDWSKLSRRVSYIDHHLGIDTSKLVDDF